MIKETFSLMQATLFSLDKESLNSDRVTQNGKLTNGRKSNEHYSNNLRCLDS